MRIWIGKRVHVPVVGSLYVGTSFNPGRVLARGGSGFAEGFSVGFWLMIAVLFGMVVYGFVH